MGVPYVGEEKKKSGKITFVLHGPKLFSCTRLLVKSQLSSRAVNISGFIPELSEM